MTTEVEHGTTTGEVFLQQPRSGITGGRIEPFESLDLRLGGYADFTRFDNLLDSCDHWIKAPIIRNAKLYAVTAGGVNHSVTLLRVHRHRLFAKHMLSCFSRRDRLHGMKMNRSSNVHRIYLVVT